MALLAKRLHPADVTVSDAEVRSGMYNKDSHVASPPLSGQAHEEHWQPIAGYEGLYEVSCLGNVRSLPRLRRNSRGGGFNQFPGRILKSARRFRTGRDYGHLKVTLSRDGRKRTVDIAILVADAFLPPRPPGVQIRHGPAGAGNNSAWNLRTGTPKQNTEDRKRDGTYLFGETASRRVLDDARVLEIRRRYPAETQGQLAVAFGVSRATIAQVVTGRTWRHLL